MLLNLLVDLFEEIASELARSDHKNLRAVCRDISLAIDPFFFSSITIRTRPLHLKEGTWLLEALASGQSRWSTYAKTLLIEPGNVPWGKELAFNPREEAQCKLLASALGSLKAIRTLSWTVGSDSAPASVISAHLPKFTLLDDFEVNLNRSEADNLALPLLSGLRTLKITTNWQPMPNAVLDIVVACAATLTTLHVSDYGDSSALWSHLIVHPGLRLKSLLVGSTVTPELLTYLASYTGLERLVFMSADGGSQPSADSLADVFFGTVLPRHAETLVEVACVAGYVSRWSVGAHNVDAICDLSKLKTLAVSVNGADVFGIESGRNAVDVLLGRIMTRLPALQTLSIFPTTPQSMRYSRCGTHPHMHQQRLTAAIVLALANFRSSGVVSDNSAICSVVVRVEGSSYNCMHVRMEGPRNVDEDDDDKVHYRFCKVEG
ncbi:hypothetical protein C8R46DRAFT_1057595 [Mycena filopes]|nr:hypothetical protein C8R46DRAFT_1057595 [Mycena filopes]